MNLLNRLTIKSLILNKKRAIGTTIGIILSVALICAVSGLATSFHQTLVQNAINETGYYHLELSQITSEKIEELKLNKHISSIKTIHELGVSKFEHDEDEDQSYIKVLSLNEADFNGLMYQIKEGEFPTNENEILISEKVFKDSNYKIGDTINLSIGTRLTSDGFELNDENPIVEENGEYLANTKNKTYKIVGIVSKYSKSFMYYGITTQEQTNNINAFISLNKPHNYKAALTNLLNANSYEDVKEYNIENLSYTYEINHELLRWEVLSFSDSTMQMLTSVVGVVLFIIMFTSIFCIRNSFAISLSEKMKMYGMLASIGATHKQIKKSVISEGMILGLIAIPFGIISGIVAVYILVEIVNIFLGDFLFGNIGGIVFKISFLPIFISMILGFVTIYFSAISSANKASKISPIDNVRNTNEIKMNSKNLHTPTIIKKVFKTGGVLAYKNLKRSKKKYRTTVISLTVSIFVFISMFAFVSEGFKQAGNYYKNLDYNFSIDLDSDYSDEKIEKIRNFDSIQNSYLLYHSSYSLKINDLSKIQQNDGIAFDCEYKNDACIEKYIALNILLLDDDSFASYINKINGDYDELKYKGILVDKIRYYSNDENEEKLKEYEIRRYKYKTGDRINHELTNGDQFKIEIGALSDIRPYGMENTYNNTGYLVLNKKYFSNLECYPFSLLIHSNDNNRLIQELNTFDDELSYNDFQQQAQNEKAMVLVISIFLYGFIAVIALIGITNIFNTITSNMELRQKEFAILKSVGMTKKEFNRMIHLETLFYSTKSLVYGTLLGTLGAYAVHKAFSTKLETAFVLPYKAILICILFVFIIVYMIMKYSIGKINKQNTIETIRNENV